MFLLSARNEVIPHGDIRGNVISCEQCYTTSTCILLILIITGKKAAIHQLTTMLSTSKNVLFPMFLCPMTTC